MPFRTLNLHRHVCGRYVALPIKGGVMIGTHGVSPGRGSAFQAERRGDVIYLRGELDLAGESEARQTVFAAATRKTSVTLDISDLTFCDSTGLTLVTDLLSRLPSGSRVRLEGASRQVYRLFEVSGLGHHPAVFLRPRA